MISGATPETAEAMIRARGFRPSSPARRSDRTTTAAAPSLSGHELPARPEGRLQLRQLLQRRLAPRSVVLRHAVPRRHLAIEEPGILRGHGALL
jgi:hypothetical protein